MKTADEKTPGSGCLGVLILSNFRTSFCQQAGDTFQFEPPLFFRTLVFGIDHAVEVTQVVEFDLSILNADERAVAALLVTLFDQML